MEACGWFERRHICLWRLIFFFLFTGFLLDLWDLAVLSRYFLDSFHIQLTRSTLASHRIKTHVFGDSKCVEVSCFLSRCDIFMHGCVMACCTTQEKQSVVAQRHKRVHQFFPGRSDQFRSNKKRHVVPSFPVEFRLLSQCKTSPFSCDETHPSRSLIDNDNTN